MHEILNKIKAVKKTKLPEPDSIAEMAEFWDTHDLTDFEDDLEEVVEPVFVRGTAFSLAGNKGRRTMIQPPILVGLKLCHEATSYLVFAFSTSTRREKKMNRLPENPQDSSVQDWDVIQLDESDCIPGSESRQETPAQRLASWRENMKHMEKLKKYRPKEYEEIMKEREDAGSSRLRNWINRRQFIAGFHRPQRRRV